MVLSQARSVDQSLTLWRKPRRLLAECTRTRLTLTGKDLSIVRFGQILTFSSNIDHVTKGHLHQHIQAFFAHVYPCQANGFIHRGTLLRNLQSERVTRKVLLAICAVTSRFIDGAVSSMSARVQAEAWAKEAKSLLVLEDMTTDTVVAALLLARHDINSGNYSSAWMLSSIATRAALALGLNKDATVDDGSLSFTEQETRRRLFWACYCLDRMMSTGLPELVVLRTEHVHLQLPCEEQQYLLDIPCATRINNLETEISCTQENPSSAQANVGMSGHYVQIMQMRYSILK